MEIALFDCERPQRTTVALIETVIHWSVNTIDRDIDGRVGDNIRKLTDDSNDLM